MKTSPKSLMNQINATVSKINSLAQAISNNKINVFYNPEGPIERFTPAELGFIKTSSWLFCTYYEIGKIGVKFLMTKIDNYGLDRTDKLFNDYELSRLESLGKEIIDDLSGLSDIARSKLKDFGIRAISDFENVTFQQLLEIKGFGLKSLKKLVAAVKKENLEIDNSFYPDHTIEGKTRQHYCLVRDLRTYLQHHLKFSSDHDFQVKQSVHQWFSNKCGTRIPSEDGEWEECLIALLNEAVSSTDQMFNCIKLIEKDEGKRQIIRAWSKRLSRFLNTYEMDEVVKVAAEDMGRHINVVEFRKRFYSTWLEQLRFTDLESDVKKMARRLVEVTLLNETENVMPLSGGDIIQEFEIVPGPDVGELLKKARKLFDSNSNLTKEDILSALSKEDEKR